MTGPQICNSKLEFLFLIAILRFDSRPQLFQLFDQGFQHHVETLSRMLWARYDEAQEYKLIFHAKRRWKVVWNSKDWPARVGCSACVERCETIGRQPNMNISRIPGKVFVKAVQSLPCLIIRGCTITPSFSRTPSLCHLMCLALRFERNNR